jgi:hypothetical protein
MNKSDEYRAKAVACANFAATVNDLTTKVVLLNMAEGWLRLADHVEHGASGLRKAFGAGNPSDQPVTPTRINHREEA